MKSEYIKLIAQKREELGKSLTDISESTGVDIATESKIEYGNLAEDVCQLEKYLDALGLELKVADKQLSWEEIEDKFGYD